MILVDTSVWVDHLRGGDAALTALLAASQILAHSFIIGEIALGSLRQRATILADLRALPSAVEAGHDEVVHFIDRHAFFGLGIGYVDAHLLSSTLLTPGASLWTRDVCARRRKDFPWRRPA